MFSRNFLLFLFEYKNAIVNFRFHRIFKSISKRIKQIYIHHIYTIIYIRYINYVLSLMC